MNHDDVRLDGRVAVVTGGGRGLGKAITLALASTGADVSINYRESEVAVRDLVREVEEVASIAVFLASDASRLDLGQTLSPNAGGMV